MDKKVIGYKFIYGEVPEEFEKNVQKAISDGWQLYGNVNIESNDEGFVTAISQAMVKYGNLDKENE